MPRNVVNWFEIPAVDLTRARAFYEHVLAVTLTPLSLGDGLTMAMFPGDPGGAGGALCHHAEHYKPSRDGVLLYLNANPDLQAVVDRIEEAGGTVLVPKTQITEEYGFMAIFLDTEGNRVALHSNG